MTYEGMIALDTPRACELGFTSDRFGGGSYLWEREDRVTISFVHSLARGNFRALVDAILAAGKEVAVPTPLPRMEQIVRKCGYEYTVEPHELGGSVDVWLLKPQSAHVRGPQPR